MFNNIVSGAVLLAKLALLSVGGAYVVIVMYAPPTLTWLLEHDMHVPAVARQPCSARQVTVGR